MPRDFRVSLSFNGLASGQRSKELQYSFMSHMVDLGLTLLLTDFELLPLWVEVWH